MAVLGHCRNDGAQRPDERIDWASLSHWQHFSLSADHRKPAALAETATGLELSGISADRCAMAFAGGVEKSSAGTDQRILLVLLCQRTLPALLKKALPR